MAQKLWNISKTDEKNMAGREKDALESFYGFYVFPYEQAEFSKQIVRNYTFKISEGEILL
ncbi:hypothetical protein HZS_2100 [Henneguya salminicola]|nr:hypothetical protein HZS_2100 [Henneguya salminicola]